jgi:hypothetical protein
MVRTRLDTGAKLADVSIAADTATWKEDAGYLRDDPSYDTWREAMEEYRRKLEEEAEAV